jgi:hypothetical protein
MKQCSNNKFEIDVRASAAPVPISILSASARTGEAPHSGKASQENIADQSA